MCTTYILKKVQMQAFLNLSIDIKFGIFVRATHEDYGVYFLRGWQGRFSLPAFYVAHFEVCHWYCRVELRGLHIS